MEENFLKDWIQWNIYYVISYHRVIQTDHRAQLIIKQVCFDIHQMNVTQMNVTRILMRIEKKNSLYNDTIKLFASSVITHLNA